MSLNTFLLNGELVIILIKKKDSVDKETSPYFISLRWVLLATYVVVGIVPLILISNTILHSVGEYFIKERETELLSQANMISGQVTSYKYLENKTNNNELEEIMLTLGQEEDFRILVFDSRSRIVYDTGYEDVGKTIVIPEVIEALGGKDVAREQENLMIYAAASIVGQDNALNGVVLIADETLSIADTVADIAKKGNILLVGLTIIVILITIVLSRVFTEPLKRMIKAVQRMSEGQFEQRVQINFPIHNEVVDLAWACNHMADQLEKVESSRQQFVSNVSHELKTPLSSVKVLSEAILHQEDVPKEMYVEFLEDIYSEVDRMAEIINDLLTLVKLDQKEIPMRFKEVDLNLMMEGIVKRLQPLAGVKEVKLEYSMKAKEALADVDEMKLILAIANIVDNAIKYTPQEGSVLVSLSADHQHAFISVADTGIGMPEDEIGNIFERFYRIDKTRDRETGGTGLGLSITHGTIMMHKGTIKVNSKEEEGTTILVRIPLHQTV